MVGDGSFCSCLKVWSSPDFGMCVQGVKDERSDSIDSGGKVPGGHKLVTQHMSNTWRWHVLQYLQPAARCQRRTWTFRDHTRWHVYPPRLPGVVLLSL